MGLSVEQLRTMARTRCSKFPRIVFVLQGLGLGTSARSHVIIATQKKCSVKMVAHSPYNKHTMISSPIIHQSVLSTLYKRERKGVDMWALA